MKFLWQILLCTFICLSVTYHATCQDFDEDDYGDEMMDDETIMNEENDDIETEEPPPPKEKVSVISHWWNMWEKTLHIHFPQIRSRRVIS